MPKVLAHLRSTATKDEIDAYLDKTHPMHDYVVAQVAAAFIHTYGDDGGIHPLRDVIMGDDGEVDWDETYDAWKEIGQANESAKLAKRGVKVDTGDVVAKDGSGPLGKFEKREPKADDAPKIRSVKELKADPAFTKALLDPHGDRGTATEVHKAAKAEWTAAHQAEAAS